MKNKIIISIFTAIIVIMAIFTITNDATISYTERRRLSSFPDNFDSDFYEEVDDYLIDHFYLRDEFLKLHSFVSTYLFQNKDIDGVYKEGNYLFMMDKKIDEESFKHFIDLHNEIIEKFFKDSAVYMIPVPLKNHYIDSTLDYDYEEIIKNLEGLNAQIIDIYDDLSLDSYYYSDLHWRQEKLDEVVDSFFEVTGLMKNDITYDYQSYSPFYGSYYSYYGGLSSYDELIYMDSPYFDDISVYSMDRDGYIQVYDTSALGSIDSYSVFLDGPSSYIKIENAKANNGQKLIVFRDSYASSFIPLLISSFSQIEVIDLRYYSSSLLDDLNLDEDATVLFLYGAQIMNSSYSLR